MMIVQHIVPSIRVRRVIATTFVVLVMSFLPMLSQQQGGSIMLQPRAVTPAEFITGDTVHQEGRLNVPGEVTVRFTPEQDTAYREALRTNISSSLRFTIATRTLSSILRTATAFHREPSPWEAAMRTMDIPTAMFIPSGQQVVQQQINVANSMYVPGVLMRPMGTGNAMINFSDIGRFFGLSEDVSPRIRYFVDETIEVHIVVYSTQARIIATVFRGIQGPGTYEIVWNGRDERGKIVSNGDYIAEVRLGNERLTRKRIVWPPQN